MAAIAARSAAAIAAAEHAPPGRGEASRGDDCGGRRRRPPPLPLGLAAIAQTRASIEGPSTASEDGVGTSR
jgi:hypothetical protein